MKITRLTFVVLGIFLILTGLAAFVEGLSALAIVIAILALAAGILILISRPGISMFAGWVLAAIYLILWGLVGIADFGFDGIDIVMAILALAAGVVLLVRWPGFRKHIGFLLFCIWLILVGLVALTGITGLSLVIAVIAIAAGILMILNE